MITISYELLIFGACILGCSFTTWRSGLKEGGRRAIDYLANEGMLICEPDIDEED